MVFLFRLPLLLLILTPMPAHAAAPLFFKSNDNDLRTRDIAAFLLENNHLMGGIPYESARVDLNGDGVEEIVFRQSPTGCTARADCPYLVAGLSAEKNPVLIARLKARKVGIADEKAYGVNNLFVYNRQHDDFAYEIYTWNPHSADYAAQ